MRILQRITVTTLLLAFFGPRASKKGGELGSLQAKSAVPAKDKATGLVEANQSKAF